jgi:hypothetical protein
MKRTGDLMAMKISQAMPGVEGLQAASVPTHAGAGSQKVSFAETIGDSLISSPVPDGAEQLTEPESRLGKSAIAAGKQDKPVLIASVPPKSAGAISKTIQEPSYSEAPMATMEVRQDLGAGSSAIQTAEAHGQEVEESSATPEPILKLQPAKSPNPADEPAANRARDVSAPVRISGVKDEEGPKEIGKHTELSATTSAKSKEAGALPRHKDKRERQESVTVQGSQKVSQAETPATPQPLVGTDPVLASGVIHSVTADGSSPSASIQVKEVDRPGGKPVRVDALRRKLGIQDAAKTSPAPHGMTGAAGEKPAALLSGESKSVGEAAVKSDPAARGFGSRDKESASSQVGVQQISGGAVAAIQTHAAATLTPERFVSTAPTHTSPLPQTDATAPHPAAGLIPGEHGTVTGTPTALEVGVPGGSHGWLTVRAELGRDGSVHASMSSNSAAGTVALQREVPQLTSYLHQEQVRVSSVVVHATQSPTALSNQLSNDGRGQSMNGGAPDANRGDSGSGNAARHSRAGIHQTSSSPDADGDLLLPRAFGSAGGWLSVRA